MAGNSRFLLLDARYSAAPRRKARANGMKTTRSVEGDWWAMLVIRDASPEEPLFTEPKRLLRRLPTGAGLGFD